MELLSPEWALLLWAIGLFVILGFIGVALVRLIKTDLLDSVSKLIWFAIIVFIPIVGSICMLLYLKNLQKNTRSIK